MAVEERLDLKLSAADKQLLAQAAAIEGLSMAAFVRLAARQRAAEAIQRREQIICKLKPSFRTRKSPESSTFSMA